MSAVPRSWITLKSIYFLSGLRECPRMKGRHARIKVSKATKSLAEQSKTGAVVSSVRAVLNTGDENNGIRIKSPIIGTAYLAAEPGAKKFVEVGDKIKKGQTILIVEAMKTMNHVASTDEGIVDKILVNDGQPVEFGQILVTLK